jgi:hypothetical protein
VFLYAVTPPFESQQKNSIFLRAAGWKKKKFFIAKGIKAISSQLSAVSKSFHAKVAKVQQRSPRRPDLQESERHG